MRNSASANECYLECYPSTKSILKQEFYVYEIKRLYTDRLVNLISLARAITGCINRNVPTCFACTDDTFIYTKVPLPAYWLKGENGTKVRESYCQYELILKETMKIPFSNTAVYDAYISLLILRKLARFTASTGFFANKNQKKYFVKNDELHTAYLYHLPNKAGEIVYGHITDTSYNEADVNAPHDVREKKRQNYKIILGRCFSIQPSIRMDGFFTVSLTSKTEYLSKQSFYHISKKDGISPEKFIGREAKYRLSTGLSQTGIIVSEKEYCAANPGKNPQEDASVTATKNYLRQRYSRCKEVQKAVQNSPADDFILYVRLNAHTVCQYLASTLHPILTTEYVAENFKKFSKASVKYMRLEMDKRIALDREVITDIGELSELGQGVKLSAIPCSAADIGYANSIMATPRLRIGNQKIILAEMKQKESLFQKNCGYYSIPQRLKDPQKTNLRINILGDAKQFTEEQLLDALRYLYQYGGMRHCSPAFSVRGEQGAWFRPKAYVEDYHQKYGINAILKKIHEMNQDAETDLNLIVLNANDPYLPADLHDRIKKDLASTAMPSQMVNDHTIKELLKDYSLQKKRGIVQKNGISNSSLRYTAYNLIMQMMAKLGCVPAVFHEPLPGNIDMILGLDVGMAAKGIHYPGCSVILDGHGNYLGSYAPERAQTGEKIPAKILEEIFDRSLLCYEEKIGSFPKGIIIMRDGFSNEDDDFYAQYFGEREIRYDIVEVRKQAGTRLAKGMHQNEQLQFANPDIGTALIKGEEGYIVTTKSNGRFGAPRPLKIVHSAGSLPMDTIMQICYSLTKNYPGSMQNIRLPLPTYIADQICKAYDRIPHGAITDQNFFM